MDKSIIARTICEKYGIEWDESQSISHISGEAVTPGVISDAFGQNWLGVYNYSIEILTANRNTYSMKSTTALVA